MSPFLKKEEDREFKSNTYYTILNSNAEFFFL